MATLKKIGKTLAKGERRVRGAVRKLTQNRGVKTRDFGIDRAIGKIPGVNKLERFVRSGKFSKMAKRRLAERRAEKDK